MKLIGSEGPDSSDSSRFIKGHDESPQALDGIRVVDVSRQAPGPYCSMLLADFGADVILVEPSGGSTRGRGTNVYWELEQDAEASAFAALRRNKRSVVLDLKDAHDRERMDALIRDADVLIEGFRPGTATRLGIDWSQCRMRNPGLVYCSITGYGQEGPMAQAAGHDINYLALSGVLAAMTDRDGRPTLPLNLIADFAGGGLMAAYSIMLALFHRERTGEGQYIDLAMLDGTYSLLTHAASLYFARGADLRSGRFFLSGGLPQYNTYQCSDGRWLAVGALEPWFFERLMVLTGRPDLAESHADSTAFREVSAHLEAWFGARSSEDVEALVGSEDVCVTPVHSFEEGLALAEQRGMVTRVGGVAQIAVAPHFSLTPASMRSPAPMIGEDTESVFDGIRG